MSVIPEYCDGHGSRVQLVPGSHLIFNGATIPLPGEDVIFPRIDPSGTKFAGTGHLTGLAWEWTGQWTQRGPSHGIQAVIYDNDGVLYIVSGPGEPAGSQGYRYIDDSNNPVPSWETYDPSTPRAIALGIIHLWEWTPLGDVVVGQGGDEGGLQALVKGRRVLLDSGDCRFIKAYRFGEMIHLAYVKNGKAAFKDLPRGSLDELPTFTVPGTPEPIPGPLPEPTPEPEPTPMPESLEAAVTDAYNRLPHDSQDDLAAILNEVAWVANGDEPQKGPWGLSTKPNGNNATLKDGTKVAYDILHHLPTDTLWDCFGPSEAPRPKWGQAEPHHDPNRPWKAPIKPQDAPGDDPGDDPDPTPSPDLEAVQKAIESIQGEIESIKTSMKASLDALEASINRLGRRTFTVTIEKKGFGPLAHTHGATVTPVDGD